MRTSAVVRHFEKKLEEEGIESDEEDEESKEVESMGTGKVEAASAETGEVVSDSSGVMGAVGKVMEGLGLAGRGKEGGTKRRRKGRDGLMDL